MEQGFGKITSLSVHGFKSIKALDNLPLRDINIIIGANGSGKSNLLKVFDLIKFYIRGDLNEYIRQRGGMSRFLYGKLRGGNCVSVGAKFGDDSFGVSVFANPDGSIADIVAGSFGPSFTAEDLLNLPYRQMLERAQKQMATASRHISRALRVHHFHDTSDFAVLRQAANLNEPDYLASDGSNLAAFLYFLQEKHPRSLVEIVNAIQRVAPFFLRFNLGPDPVVPNSIALRWEHQGLDGVWDASDLSDGTLRFIALATLLLQPDPRERGIHTIILDEPELGLHPYALELLAGIIRSVSHHVQIICATQSAQFANMFDWQDIIVADRVENASTFRRLTEEEVKVWLDDYGVGDIWTKNLIGGNP